MEFDPLLKRYSWAYLNLIGQDKYNDWTPQLTFTTPGNLVVGYSIRIGTYTRKGNEVQAWYSLTASTFTHSSAAASMEVRGLPFVARNYTNNIPVGSVSWGGINKANYTQVVPYLLVNTTTMRFRASGMAQAAADVDAADVSTGSVVTLFGSIKYEA